MSRKKPSFWTEAFMVKVVKSARGILQTYPLLSPLHAIRRANAKLPKKKQMVFAGYGNIPLPVMENLASYLPDGVLKKRREYEERHGGRYRFGTKAGPKAKSSGTRRHSVYWTKAEKTEVARLAGHLLASNPTLNLIDAVRRAQKSVLLPNRRRSLPGAWVLSKNFKLSVMRYKARGPGEAGVVEDAEVVEQPPLDKAMTVDDAIRTLQKVQESVKFLYDTTGCARENVNVCVKLSLSYTIS